MTLVAELPIEIVTSERSLQLLLVVDPVSAFTRSGGIGIATQSAVGRAHFACS